MSIVFENFLSFCLFRKRKSPTLLRLLSRLRQSSRKEPVVLLAAETLAVPATASTAPRAAPSDPGTGDPCHRKRAESISHGVQRARRRGGIGGVADGERRTSPGHSKASRIKACRSTTADRGHRRPGRGGLQRQRALRAESRQPDAQGRVAALDLQPAQGRWRLADRPRRRAVSVRRHTRRVAASVGRPGPR